MNAMMTGGAQGKERAHVESAAKVVYEWLKAEDSTLRTFVSALSDGGIFFVSSCHFKTCAAAVRYRKEHEVASPGIMEPEFVNVAVRRLCD